MYTITELLLPIDPNVLSDSISGGWIPAIAGRHDHEVVDMLKARWSLFQSPYLQKLSAAILDGRLKCLSIDEQGFQWLSFEFESSRRQSMHVAAPSFLPGDLRSKFPFDKLPGTAEFLENFGGLVNGVLPPYPWFMPASECRVVASDCDAYDWGLIGKWAGALTLYNTRAGNFMVLSPENRCAKWDHDIGWEREDQDPFQDLGWSISTLVEEFIGYLSLDETEAQESPFYY